MSGNTDILTREHILFYSMLTGKFEDIISVGFCDDSGTATEYIMDVNRLYLQFEQAIISLETIHNYSQLLIKHEKEIKFDYPIDEDMKYAFSKLHNITLRQGEMSDVSVEKVVLYNLHSLEENHLTCDALKLILSSGQILFFDPAYYFGIKVGDEEELIKIWEEQNKQYTVHIIQ